MRYLSVLVHRERGQILMLSALLITALVGFVGLVVDGGHYYAQRRQAQNAADEAAVAAAYALRDGADATQAARDYAAANGFDNDGVSNTVTVNIPPTSGEHTGDPDYVEVIVAENPRTFFIHVLLPDAGGVSARGVAGFTVASGEGYAIFAANSDCALANALELSGSVNIVNGDVHSNSTMRINGSNNTFNGQTTYSCALDVPGSGNSFNPAPSSAPNQPMPVTYSYGDFPCTMSFTADTDLSSVSTAWVGSDPSSGQLLPGVYCSTGKLTLSGSGVTGNVTLVAQGEVNVSGSNFQLTPYWNNVLLFSAASAPLGIDASGSGGSWEGIMLAPNGRAKVAGSSNLSISGSIMADLVQVSGSNFSLTATDYGFGGLGTVALVE